MSNFNERLVTLVSFGAPGGATHLVTPRGERIDIQSATYEIGVGRLGMISVSMFGRVGDDFGDGARPESSYAAWRTAGNPCPTCGSTARLALQKADSEFCTPRRHLCLACLTDNDVVTKLDAVTL